MSVAPATHLEPPVQLSPGELPLPLGEGWQGLVGIPAASRERLIRDLTASAPGGPDFTGISAQSWLISASTLLLMVISDVHARARAPTSREDTKSIGNDVYVGSERLA